MESENASKRSLRRTEEEKPSATDGYMILSVVIYFYEVKFILNVYSAFLLVDIAV